MYIERPLLVLSAVLVSTACGAPDDSPEDIVETDVLGPEEREEIAAIRQQLSEPGCGTIAADAVLVPDGSGGGEVTSPDGNYDHPECRNGFLVDINALEAGRHPFTSRFWIPQDLFACLFSYGYAGLWQKQGGAYRLVQETIAWGYLGFSRSGFYCSIHAEVTTPMAGDYRVVAASGQLFLPNSAVNVGLAQPLAQP